MSTSVSTFDAVDRWDGIWVGLGLLWILVGALSADGAPFWAAFWGLTGVLHFTRPWFDPWTGLSTPEFAVLVGFGIAYGALGYVALATGPFVPWVSLLVGLGLVAVGVYNWRH